MHKILSYALVRAHHHKSGGKQSLYAVATDKRGRIIAEGGNSYEVTHPLQASSAKIAGSSEKCFLHAEIAVLAKLLRKRMDCAKLSLYVARANRRGDPMLAKPCPICAKALDMAGFKTYNILYTTSEGELT